MTNIESKINGLIARTNRTWGIYAQDIDSGKKFAVNENRVFETASTIKVFILLALFDKITKEKISLRTPIKIKKKHIGTVGRSSGISQYFYLTQPLPLYNVALLMIIVSDNPCTNVLIEYLGKEKINQYIVKKLGLKKTKLLTNKVDFHKDFSFKNTKMGSTTPYEIALTLKKLEEDKLFDNKTSRKIIEMLTHQFYSESIPRYLPTWANVGMERYKIKRIANKTGSITYEDDDYFTTRSDAALIYTKNRRRFVISIYHEGSKDNNHIYTADNKNKIIGSKISAILFNYFYQGNK